MVCFEGSLTIYWCLPHARGGVSAVRAGNSTSHGSSPRPWGCFPDPWHQGGRRHVFPTPVGVFLLSVTRRPLYQRLPHARGGVSNPQEIRARDVLSSPRPWGCFCSRRKDRRSGRVFPTPVGVFLSRSRFRLDQTGLPHARGGVSCCQVIVRSLSSSSPRPWGCF